MTTHRTPFTYRAAEVSHFLGGIGYTFRFDNGYGASVIRHSGSYGGPEGLYELAVLDRDARLTYTTPITGDVIGHLSVPEVNDYLDQIRQLVIIGVDRGPA